MQLKRSTALVLALVAVALLGPRLLAYGPGWTEVKPMTHDALSKPVGAGAWMVPHGDVVYTAKGNKTTNFYKYYPALDSWEQIAPIPDTEPAKGKIKPAAKGCYAVADGGDYLYMVKGNSTTGFWRYNMATAAWDTLSRVPVKPKAGDGMAYVRQGEDGYVYLLAGGKTAFYRYDVDAGTWGQLDSAPYGNGKAKYAAGSFLAYDGDNTIYAQQAGQVGLDSSHFMFRYDIAADTWMPKGVTGMPLYGTDNGKVNKKKKVKDGAHGAWYNDHIYAFKGACQGFYRYDVDGDSWHELDTVPRNGSSGLKKAVKTGGFLVSLDDGSFLGLKGNKTFEAWVYTEPELYASRSAQRSGTQSSGLVSSRSFSVSPNPISSGFATVRLSLPKAGPVSVRVYDALGRVVLSRTYGAVRTAVSLDLRSLAGGVYLVKADAKGFTAAQKLVVQK